MHRRLLLLLPIAALLAGCTAPAPAPSATPSSAVSAAASLAPVAEPAPLPAEVARAVVGASVTSSTSGFLPAARTVYVHARCSGPAGSTMRFRLLTAQDARFGPSADLACDGTESTSGSAGAGRAATTAHVVVQASRGVTGYAVLSTSAER